jgi:hypothetical protein
MSGPRFRPRASTLNSEDGSGAEIHDGRMGRLLLGLRTRSVLVLYAFDRARANPGAHSGQYVATLSATSRPAVN